MYTDGIWAFADFESSKDAQPDESSPVGKFANNADADRGFFEQKWGCFSFLREEYINAGWFKRFLLRLEFLFRDTRGESHIPQIPEHIRKEIARCLLPDIVAYFESDQGQREFAEWKAQQEADKKEKSEVA